MQFIDLIAQDVCHPKSLQLQKHPPELYCTVCKNCPISNIYEYIVQEFPDHFHSSELAQAYYNWTKDEKTPMTFTLVDIQGIYPGRIVAHSILQIRESVDHLTAINAPFTTKPAVEHTDAMNTFLTRFLDTVSQHKNSSTDFHVIEQIVEGMHHTIQNGDYTNPFQFYMSKLAPYVQTCLTDWTPIPATEEDPNLAKELLLQLQLSSQIRKVFGKYSIAFDVLHAMIGSYACSSDMEKVGNWVLDLMARICRGQYFWKVYPDCRYVQAMNSFLEREVSYKKRPHLYYVMRAIRQGNASDNLSESWSNYCQLQNLVNEKFTMPHVPFDILQMVCIQLFPAILFEDHSDQLGFALALGHVILTVDPKTGFTRKGSFKKARKIHEIIRRYVNKVRSFEGDSDGSIWNMETLRVFLVSQPNLDEEMRQLTNLVFMKDEEDDK